MKTSLRLLGFSVACLLAVTATHAQSAMEADKPVPPSVLKKYDKNKNGALDENETAKWQADLAARREKDRAARQERLEKYDADKDGKLSEDEKVAARFTMEKERTERELAKGKEKAAERIAREAREKAEAEKAAGESAAPAADPMAPAAPAEGGMMMMQ